MDICRDDPLLVFPHHDECQLYYNCSLTYTSIPSHLEQHMVECPYPSLFSTQSLRCENFTDVCCGLRKELKDKCTHFLFWWYLKTLFHAFLHKTALWYILIIYLLMYWKLNGKPYTLKRVSWLNAKKIVTNNEIWQCALLMEIIDKLHYSSSSLNAWTEKLMIALF